MNNIICTAPYIVMYDTGYSKLESIVAIERFYAKSFALYRSIRTRINNYGCGYEDVMFEIWYGTRRGGGFGCGGVSENEHIKSGDGHGYGTTNFSGQSNVLRYGYSNGNGKGRGI